MTENWSDRRIGSVYVTGKVLEAKVEVIEVFLQSLCGRLSDIIGIQEITKDILRELKGRMERLEAYASQPCVLVEKSVPGPTSRVPGDFCGTS